MKSDKAIIFISSAFLLWFISGCCTMSVWNHAGVREYCFTDVKITPRATELQVDYYGTTETFLFDGLPLSVSGTFSGHISYPLNVLPDKQYGIPYQKVYHISANKNITRFAITPFRLYTVGQSRMDIHPADVLLLAQPHIELDHLGFHHLIIPLSVNISADKATVNGYRARSPQISYNLLTPSGKFRKHPDETMLILWRCCLLPVPLVIDTATLPFQMIILWALH